MRIQQIELVDRMNLNQKELDEYNELRDYLINSLEQKQRRMVKIYENGFGQFVDRYYWGYFYRTIDFIKTMSTISAILFGISFVFIFHV